VRLQKFTQYFKVKNIDYFYQNSEAEKIQVLVSKLCYDDSNEFFAKLEQCNKSSCKIVDTVLMKEWLLLKKLQTVLDIDCFFYEESKC
jgi:hypothetical protein